MADEIKIKDEAPVEMPDPQIINENPIPQEGTQNGRCFRCFNLKEENAEKASYQCLGLGCIVAGSLCATAFGIIGVEVYKTRDYASAGGCLAGVICSVILAVSGIVFCCKTSEQGQEDPATP